MSKHMAVSGRNNPHLRNDLSERIYGGYRALGRSRISNARGKIAAALNKRDIKRRTHKQVDSSWDGYSVIERVKRYESALKKKEAGIDPGELVQRLRRQFAEKWIPMYKARIVDGSQQESDRHG